MSSFARRSLLFLALAGIALAVSMPAAAAPAATLMTPTELNALVVRSEALNRLHQNNEVNALIARSVELNRLHQDAELLMSPAELRALELRSQALNQLHAPASTVVSPAELRALNIRSAELNRLYGSQPSGSTGSGFEWWYGVAGGLGAFGLALAVGGVVMIRRRSVTPVTA